MSDSTRTGYTFTGWTNASGTTVTGINASTLSSSFSSADDMKSKLNARTTGNQVLTANWQDTTAPTISVSNTVNGSTYSGAWTNGTITSVITFSDSGSGINASSLAWGTDGTNWTSLSNSSTSTFTDTWAAEGSRKGYYRICDNAGNCNSVSFDVKIDKSGPTGTVSMTYNDGFTATVSNLSDSLSGSSSVVGYLITTSSSCPTSGYTSSTATSYTFSGSNLERTYYACVKVKDTLGNVNYLISSATKPTIYAVYSATDTSLRFYRTTDTITAGSTYNGRTVTAAYSTGYTSYPAAPNLPWYDYLSSITTVAVEDEMAPKYISVWFHSLRNCSSFDLSKLNTSNIVLMHNLFVSSAADVSSAIELDLSSWDTAKVTDMHNMFYDFGHNSSSVTIKGLGNWNTSKVTDMRSMFYGVGRSSSSLKIEGLSNWDVSNVTDMYQTFEDVGKSATTFDIGDLSAWDTSSVTIMWRMFRYTGYTATGWSMDLSGWNVSKVTDYEDFNYGVTDKVIAPTWVN